MSRHVLVGLYSAISTSLSISPHLCRLRFSRYLGNVAFNSIWEACVSAEWKKPRPHDSHAVRDRFIRAKYQRRMFLAQDQLLSTPDESLAAACRTDDVIAALTAIAHGADVGFAKQRPEYGMASPSSSTSRGTGVLPSEKVSSSGPPPPPPPKMPPPSANSSSGKTIPAASAVLRSPSRDVDASPVCGNVPILSDADVTASPISVFIPATEGYVKGDKSNRVTSEESSSERGLSPLHTAVLYGSTACVVLMLMNGADPQSSCSDNDISDGCMVSPAVSLIEVGKKAGHDLIVGYLQRKLDALPANKLATLDAKPPAIVPSSSSVRNKTPSPIPDKISSSPSSSPVPFSGTPNISAVIEPAAIKNLLPIAPVADCRKSFSNKEERPIEEEEDDDLEDFYAALMSEDPKPKPAPKGP